MQHRSIYLYSAVVLPFVFAVSLISVLAINGGEEAKLEYKLLFANKDIVSCKEDNMYCVDKSANNFKIYKNREHKTLEECQLKVAAYDAMLDKIEYFNISYNQCKMVKPHVPFTIKGLEKYRLIKNNSDIYNSLESPDGYVFKQKNTYGQPSLSGRKITIEKGSTKFIIDHRLLIINNDGLEEKYMKLQAWIK